MPLIFGSSSAAEAAAIASSFSNMGLAVPVSSPLTFGVGSKKINSDLNEAVTSAKYRSAKVNKRIDDAVNNFFVPAMEVRDQLHDSLLGSGQLATSANKVSGSRSSSASSVSSSVPSMAAINYIDAPLAQQYGMDALTAYQEALANTAHQREMLDLQRAGLNPVLAARYSGAGVFTPDSMVTASSSDSSGSGGSGRSAKQTSGLLPTLLGAIATIASGKTAVGAAVSTVAEAVLPALKNK